MTATDLNQDMLDYARSRVAPSSRLVWRTADASALPFPAESFDALVCQFGLMFVPDKELAFREAHRVLRKGGAFFFNVWSQLDENPFARLTHETIGGFFDTQKPTFYQVPFSLHDPEIIRSHLRSAGFRDVTMNRLSLEARAPSAEAFARGLVIGNPVAHAIREAGLPFAPIIAAVKEALVAEGGDAPFTSPMNALVWCARIE